MLKLQIPFILCSTIRLHFKCNYCNAIKLLNTCSSLAFFSGKFNVGRTTSCPKIRTLKNILRPKEIIKYSSFSCSDRLSAGLFYDFIKPDKYTVY